MMLSLELPCGVIMGVQPITEYRPLLGVYRHPREVSCWLFWFSLRFTRYPSTRRGQNALRLNNADLFAVFPR